MKHNFWIGAAAIAILSIFVSACSDDPVSNNQGTATFQVQLEGTVVNRTFNKQEGSFLAAGAEVDSLRVSRVRVLIKELKLHRNNEDSITGDKTVKVGPILITADSAGTTAFASEPIPAGSYDKLKFEIHRFSSSEVSQYLADPVFADFVTGDRYSVIIDGVAYKGGTAFPYSYRSNITANLQFKFQPVIDVASGGSIIIVVKIDPIAVFKKGGKILDPRDGSNENEIDNAIKSAIKALKK